MAATTLSRIGRTVLVEIPHRLPGMMGPRACYHPAGHHVLVSVEIADGVGDGWDVQADLDKAIRSWSADLPALIDFADLAACDDAGDIHDSELPRLAEHLDDYVGRSMPLVWNGMTSWVWRQDLRSGSEDCVSFQPHRVGPDGDDAASFRLHSLGAQDVQGLLLDARARIECDHDAAVATSTRHRQAVTSWHAAGGPGLWLDTLDLAGAALEHQLGDLYGLYGIYFEQPELAVAALALALYLEAVEQQVAPGEVRLEALTARFHQPGAFKDLAGWNARLAAAGHLDDPVTDVWKLVSAPVYPWAPEHGTKVGYALGPVLKNHVRARLWPGGYVTATAPLHPWTA